MQSFHHVPHRAAHAYYYRPNFYGRSHYSYARPYRYYVGPSYAYRYYGPRYPYPYYSRFSYFSPGVSFYIGF